VPVPVPVATALHALSKLPAKSCAWLTLPTTALPLLHCRCMPTSAHPMQSTTSRAERYAWPGRLCLCCCASSDPEPVPSKIQEAERLLLKQTPLLRRRSTGQPDTGPTMLCRSWRSGTTPQPAASSSLTKTCSQSIGARNGVRTRRISSRGSGGSWRWLAYRRHLDFTSSGSRCSAKFRCGRHPIPCRCQAWCLQRQQPGGGRASWQRRRWRLQQQQGGRQRQSLGRSGSRGRQH
jgi:hypothetical protein